MTDREGEQEPLNIRLLLDASALARFGRSEHVGEPIAALGDEDGFAQFGVSVLALAAAWSQAADKEARDLLVNLTVHPRFVALDVTADHALCPDGDGGWESPLTTWSDLGSLDLVHSLVEAIDHGCQILTVNPEVYGLDGITIPIADDDDGWPDVNAYWPT